MSDVLVIKCNSMVKPETLDDMQKHLLDRNKTA